MPPKYCVDCVFYRGGSNLYSFCSGPHVPTNVGTGEKLMRLPNARLSGGEGLLRDVGPCGEKEARHWQPLKPPSTPRRWWNPWRKLDV